MVELEFEKNDPSEYPPVVDILQFDHKKLKLEDDMNKTYDEKPCCVYFKTVSANVIKGHHLKRNTYLLIIFNWFFRYYVENICKFDESH